LKVHHAGMTTTTRTPSERIIDEVCAWEGVSTRVDERYGHVAFLHGRRELGHLHGDRTLHLGFPKATWHELHEQGRIDYHPVFPGKPGYAARRIETEDDVRDVVALLRINYDRSAARPG
jgi:hypothetical protein